MRLSPRPLSNRSCFPLAASLPSSFLLPAPILPARSPLSPPPGTLVPSRPMLFSPSPRQPTNHVLYGDDVAILAGDAMLSTAFEYADAD